MAQLSERSLSEVLHDIVGNIQEIIASEVRLATVEIKAEAAKAVKAGRPLGAGIVLALYGFGLLLLAAVYALSTVVAPWLAAAIVGAGVTLIALALISVGRSRLQLVEQPEKTLETLKENVQWAKNQSR